MQPVFHGINNELSSVRTIDRITGDYLLYWQGDDIAFLDLRASFDVFYYTGAWFREMLP
jgi:hypothetical protein